MRPFLAIALTITAAITFVVFIYHGQPVHGFFYSLVPGVTGFAFVPHKEQRVVQAPLNPPRSTNATPHQVSIQEKRI